MFYKYDASYEFLNLFQETEILCYSALKASTKGINISSHTYNI